MPPLAPVYLNGAYVLPDEAVVPVTDRGLLLGLGAFETLRAYGGRSFRLRAHLSRLASTLEWLGIEVPESADALAEAVSEVVSRCGQPEVRVRVTVTAGAPAQSDSLSGRESGAGHDERPTRIVTAERLGFKERPFGARGTSALVFRLPRGVGALSGRKLTSFASNVLARRWAGEQGAGEAILVDEQGRVVEGAYSNVFAVSGGRVMTPTLSSGALPGITRQVVLSLLPQLGLEGGETEMQAAELSQVDELFVTSSVSEVIPVVYLDGAPVGGGVPGPVSQRIWEAYRALARGEPDSA